MQSVDSCCLANLGSVLTQYNQVQDCAEVVKMLAAHVPELRIGGPNEKIYTFVNQRNLKDLIDKGQPLRIEKYDR